jgi:hypothetical protein
MGSGLLLEGELIGKLTKQIYCSPSCYGDAGLTFPGLRPVFLHAIVQPLFSPTMSRGGVHAAHMPRTCVLVQNWGYGVSRVRSPLFGADSQRLGPIKQFGAWQAL